MRLRRVFLLLLAVLAGHGAAAEPMALCGKGLRGDCVVDGDTVWIGREKIRLANIDAPESDGKCDAERELAARARARLAELMGEAGSIRRIGTDVYGRTLAVIGTRDDSVNEILVSEKLVRRWEGRRRSWCGVP